MASDVRKAEVTIEIAASREEIWAALTEADQLVNWFPLQAAVQPGVGGETRWSWDGEWTWASVIDRWEPGAALRLVNRDQRPFDVDGKELLPGAAVPATLTMDFTLETAAGSTVLRLVHAGFGRGADWDDELDGVAVGWQFELRSLKHYLERHRGRRRRAAAARISTSLTHDQAWKRLRGDGGFAVSPWPPTAGVRHAIDSGCGRFTGDLLFALPDRELAIVPDELGAGILRIGTHRASRRTGVTVWFASYAADQRHVADLAATAQTLLTRLFSNGRGFHIPRAVIGFSFATLIALGGVATGATSARGQSPSSNEVRAFDRIKALAGVWETAGPSGEKVRVVYEVVSGGRAVVERVIGVAEHGESGMMSVFHLSQDRLAMSHFCVAGNQPRFEASRVDDGVIEFRLVPGSVGSLTEGHIHSVVFRFAEADRIESDWDWWERGAMDHRLIRRQVRLSR